MNAATKQIATRKLGAKTLKALAKRGITVTGITAIPGDGAMPWANASTGFILCDNGCERIRTEREVRAMAEV